MTQQKRGKLNKLIQELPDGLLASAAWLERKGYSSALRNQYVKAGWLEQPARGVFRRPGGPIKWQHVVISMQTLLDIHPLVGGRTALELHGYTHYVSASGPQEVHLYHPDKLPGWLFKLECDAVFISHNSKRLFRNEPIYYGLGNVDFDLRTGRVSGGERYGPSLTEKTWGEWDWPITLSTPERAILELLDEVPNRETFHQADMFMEGLRTLSPRRLQKLLEDCKNVKVKRLFLWMAHRHGFRYLNQIDEKRIDLGSGKRSLVKGGYLDPKYLITVPEDMRSDA
jgi:hypothetical protein